MMKNKILLVVSLLLTFFFGKAEVVLPKILGSNMVLQQNKALPIWGTAASGEEVEVKFNGQIKKAKADSIGRWEVLLDPLKASFEPAVMTISGENSIALHNILVGEVWLCSGQSNMEYTMNKSSKYADAARSKGLTKETLKEIKNPEIRVFLVKRNLYDNNEVNRGWEEAESESLKDFSAAGYFFGVKLNEALRVPIGVISSAVPGSPIERWAPEEVFTGSKEIKVKQVPSREEIKGLNAGKFYYERIQPIAPFALAGFLWYQGETNCFKGETFQYTDKMLALIETWRSVWKDDGLPFYYVQIAPFYYSKSEDHSLTEETLPEFWEAQTAALQIPNTGMIVTTDLVDDLTDIHPSYKWQVGKRLALLALGKTYDKKAVVYSGPVFKELKIKRNKILVSFSHKGGGLVSSNGKILTCFTIAGDDGVFVPAEAFIKGKKVVLSSSRVLCPTAVRFGWNEAAQPNLFNKEGLPARPFRSNAPVWQGGK